MNDGPSDLFIVFGTLCGILISFLTDVTVGPSTTIIRSFRIFRIFRLVKRAKSLKLMFNTFVVTLPAMTNIGGLLMLMLYLYSILGVYLFAEVKLTSPMDSNANFKTMSNAFLFLLRMSTGEGWHTIMWATTRQASIDSSV